MAPHAGCCAASERWHRQFRKLARGSDTHQVVALYTAIIAGCQSVLNQDGHSSYLAFRLVIYLIALVFTISIAFRSVRPAVNGAAGYRNRRTLQSPELLTATLS